MDQFQENSDKQDQALVKITSHNAKLKEALPEVEEQIRLMKEELEKMEAVSINAEMLKDDTFRPKDEIDQLILKY